MIRKAVNNKTSHLLAFVLFIVASFQTVESAIAQNDPPEAVAIYNTAANAFKDKQYELAIEQWKSLLAKYPDYSLRRDTQHYIGLAHYNLKEYEQAVEQFTSLRDSLPNIKDYRRSEKTLMYLAFSQYQVGKNAGEDGVDPLRQSLKTYEQFFENFSTSDMAAEALYFRGEAFYELDRADPSANSLGDAAKSYKKVLDDHPEAEIAQKASFAYGACLEGMGEYKQALEIYTAYVDKYPNEPFTNDVRVRKADTLLQLGIASKSRGDRDEASQRFAAAESIYDKLSQNPDFQFQASAMYQRALCLLHLDQFGTAADLYASIASNHPGFEFAEIAAVDAGKYFFIDGRMDVAEKWLGDVVQAGDQRMAEASHWLCQVKLKKNEYQEALKLARAGLANEPGIHEVNLLMDAADAMHGIPEKQSEANQAYDDLANEFPHHNVAPKALYFASHGFMTAGQNAEAIKSAERFRNAYPNDELLPDALEILARISLKEKNFAVANQIYTDLVNQFQDHDRFDWWQTRLGWARYLQSDFDGAIGWLSQSVLDMKDPVSVSEARYLIGSSQYELKNYAKAIEALNASLTANEKRANANDIRVLTARAHDKLGETTQAIELASKVLDESRLPEAAYWLGEFQYKAGAFDAAVKNYNLVLESQIENNLQPDALYGLAWAYSSAGNADDALATFDKLIEDFPDHARVEDALIGRGKTRRIAGQFAESIKDLNNYLAGDPSDLNRYNGTYERALCHVGLKDWKAAIEDLESLSSQEFRSDSKTELADDVLFELAWAYQEDEQLSKAVQTFQQVADDFEESPHASESNYHVGQKLYEEEKFDEAIARYQSSLDNSENARVGELAAYKMAWCHFKKSDYPESLKAFQAQVEKFPNGSLRAVGLSMVAESHFQLKQHAEAVTAYKVAIPAIESSDVKNNVRVLAPIHAAQSANKVKDFEAALSYARIVIDGHEDSPYAADAWYETGVAHKGLGNRDKAVEAWKAAMDKSIGKTGARARCMIGEEYFADKKYEDAINSFKLVIYGYGGTESTDDIKPWQAFASYEAARCYYVQIQDASGEQRESLINNATKFFQVILDNYPNDQLAPDAQKQLGVLKSLK